MKRVLHVVNSMNRGGIQAFIMNVYRKIDKSKIQFDFLLRVNYECDYNEEIRKLGGKIYYVPSRREKPLEQKMLLQNFFNNHTEYDVLHIHVSSLTNIDILKIAKSYYFKKILIHAHSTTTSKNIIHKVLHCKHKMEITKYKLDLCACSKAAAEFMYGKKNLDKVKIINNGINSSEFLFNYDIRKVKRKELQIDEDTFVLGHIGRFNKVKNHSFLIDILKEILEINKDTVLILIGKEDEQQAIRNKVKDLKIENNVRFLGVRDDINQLLMAMDVFVFPSFKEGLPVSVIEAQASGLKCFLSDTITKEVNITGNVKFLSLNDNPKIWAKEILDERNFKRDNVYKKILKSGYDIESTTQELEKMYI